ncbi:MAG: lipoyl(octanoyl) transferase LipB [Candidatus Zixiibacteriota bacterium]|nr:MAG: lipoyl(octanoyl) transferase LipB [candidate division Zixibacteria bacterium]
MARDTILMVEHPPVVTIGKDGHKENYESLDQEPFFIERGGDVTYHGPGQLVIYFIFNLARRGRDIHDFMAKIQDGIIHALAAIDIGAARGEEHTGVWVDGRKIASIGIAVKNWISFHGAAVNLNTDLAEFEQISPCGLDAEVMTSAAKLLDKEVDMEQFAGTLLDAYSKIFRTDFYDVKLEEIAEDIESQAGGNVI